MSSKIEKKKKAEIVKYDAKEIFSYNIKPTNFKHVKTVALATKDKADSLALINKKVGKKVSLAIIKTWIINLNDFLNLSRKMTPSQIEETADLIYDEFYYFKCSDISLVFKRIKTGYYGKLYESMDGMKIIDFLYQYGQERMNMFITSTESESSENKQLDKLALPTKKE